MFISGTLPFEVGFLWSNKRLLQLGVNMVVGSLLWTKSDVFADSAANSGTNSYSADANFGTNSYSDDVRARTRVRTRVRARIRSRARVGARV